MKKIKLSLVPYLTILAIVAAGFIGWCMNAYHLFTMIGQPVGTEFILRIVGIFVAPLGSIMGLFF
jgi:hypothetical protein